MLWGSDVRAVRRIMFLGSLLYLVHKRSLEVLRVPFCGQIIHNAIMKWEELEVGDTILDDYNEFWLVISRIGDTIGWVCLETGEIYFNQEFATPKLDIPFNQIVFKGEKP